MSKISETLVGKSYAEYKQDKKYLMISNIALSAVVLILSYFLLTRDEIIVMVPPQLEAEAKIINGKGNEEYQKRFAFSFAHLIGNANPKNVEFIIEQMDKSFSPALRDAVGQSIENATRILRSRKLESTFVVDDMLYNKHKDIVWVWGDRTIKGDGIPPITEAFTYEFQIIPVNGFPRITHYNSYEGHPIKQTITQRGESLKPRFNTIDEESLANGLNVKINQGQQPTVDATQKEGEK
jgi:conjugal transfer pilus assembly protein TraE